MHSAWSAPSSKIADAAHNAVRRLWARLAREVAVAFNRAGRDSGWTNSQTDTGSAKPAAALSQQLKKPAVRILIADDHEMIRHGLRKTLEQREDWQVCGEATNGREAVELAKKLMPNVVILDLTMPELNGLEATSQIKKLLPNAEVMIFSLHESSELTRRVLEAGARGYLLKSDMGKHVIAAVEALAEHKVYFTWAVSKTMLDAYLRDGSPVTDKIERFSELTPREREIIQLLGEGHSNKGISARLGISVKTVETHRAAIMRKLNINSFAHLVRYAIRNRIVEV
jgi:DNA-binding NarL/FixJ family response regulator